MANSTHKGYEKPDELQMLGFQVREAYKSARTNIVYSLLKKGCKKIAFTSTQKGEGKTVTSSNIAYALAQQVDTKVLLIDCDLRAPKVQAVLGIEPTPGLTNYLNDECEITDIIKTTTQPNFHAICYGAIPPNPSELLASENMMEFVKLVEHQYDYIIFDTPPVGVVIDAIPLVKLADGVVIVAGNNQTTYPMLRKTIDTVKRANGKVLGVVINRADLSDSSKGKKYSNYSYYGYGYGY